ncbi:PAS domain-containing protein [Brevibacillus borstelensis]|nr:PAS domain-containing protein [Brevibacillus borstelensis]MED1874461.1 PAS domain-containing protein [Brevibacillus borstelensis]WNF03583.1 PAS domain-containing protein [Brevibacillus borstelensis]
MKDHTLIQAILDASHDGIIAVDQNSTVIWVNKNALEILEPPGERALRL